MVANTFYQMNMNGIVVTRECEFEAGKYRQPLLDPGWPGLRPGSPARRLQAGCAAQKSLFQDAANRARLRERGGPR